jgi:hypothetical protein
MYEDLNLRKTLDFGLISTPQERGAGPKSVQNPVFLLLSSQRIKSEAVGEKDKEPIV